MKFDWREDLKGVAIWQNTFSSSTRWYVFQMMWSFQDGPASALPLTQTLSNIYGRRSASPDVPGSNLDETQVRKWVNFAKVNFGLLKHICSRDMYCYCKLKLCSTGSEQTSVVTITTWLTNMFSVTLSLESIEWPFEAKCSFRFEAF